MLLLLGLERAMAKLGARVDELELHLLQVPSAGVHHQALADRNNTLLRPRDRALEHQEVVLHDTVVGESTQRRDNLVGRVRLGPRVRLVLPRANTVDLLVEFRAVVVSIYAPVSVRPALGDHSYSL